MCPGEVKAPASPTVRSIVAAVLILTPDMHNTGEEGNPSRSFSSSPVPMARWYLSSLNWSAARGMTSSTA